jgi:hypothetical protein
LLLAVVVRPIETARGHLYQTIRLGET